MKPRIVKHAGCWELIEANLRRPFASWRVALAAVRRLDNKPTPAPVIDDSAPCLFEGCTRPGQALDGLGSRFCDEHRAGWDQLRHTQITTHEEAKRYAKVPA